MAGSLGAGIVKGLGVALQLDYQERKEKRDRAWQEGLMDRKVEDALFTYESQKVLDQNLVNEAAQAQFMKNPQNYLSTMYGKEAAALGLEGRDAAKHVNKRLKAVDQRYLTQLAQSFTKRKIDVKSRTIGTPQTIGGEVPAGPIDQVEVPSAEPIQVSPGAILVDPDTKQTVASAPFKPESQNRVDIVNVETGEEEGMANYDPTSGQLWRDVNGQRVTLDPTKYRAFVRTQEGPFGGKNKPLEKSLESTRTFVASTNQFVGAIVKASNSIDINETSPAKFSASLLTALSNVSAETKGLLELAKDTELGKSFVAEKREMIADEERWQNIEGVDEKLLTHANFRDAMLTITFAKLAMNSQTGRDVSAPEFQRTLEAVAGNMSDGRIVKAKLATLLDDADLRINDYYKSEIPRSHFDSIEKEYPSSALRKKLSDARGEMGINKSNLKAPEAAQAQQAPEVNITAQASQQLQAIEQAYRQAPAEEQPQMLRQMLEHGDARIRALAQKIQQQ